MRMKLSTVALAAAGVLASTAAAPAGYDAKTLPDLKCLIAITRLAPVMEKSAPGSASVAAMYFLGKLDGEDPSLNLEAAIRELGPKMSQQDVGHAGIRCGGELKTRGASLSAIGADLEK